MEKKEKKYALWISSTEVQELWVHCTVCGPVSNAMILWANCDIAHDFELGFILGYWVGDNRVMCGGQNINF